MTKQLFGSGEPSRLTRAHARLRNLERRIADPIGIRFNFANEGDWLQISTTSFNPDTVQVGGPHGVSGNWAISISGDGDFGYVGIGAEQQLWLTSNDLEITSGDGGFDGFIQINAHGDGGQLNVNAGNLTVGVSQFIQISAGGGLEFDVDGGINIDDNDGSGIFLTSTGGDINVTTTGGGTQTFTSGDGFIFDSTHTGGSLVALAVRVHSGDAFIVEDSDNSLARLFAISNAAMEFRLPTSTYLRVYDHSGNRIFEVDENGDLHGKTGKALTFDL